MTLAPRGKENTKLSFWRPWKVVALCQLQAPSTKAKPEDLNIVVDPCAGEGPFRQHSGRHIHLFFVLHSWSPLTPMLIWFHFGRAWTPQHLENWLLPAKT